MLFQKEMRLPIYNEVCPKSQSESTEDDKQDPVEDVERDPVDDEDIHEELLRA